MRARRKDQAGFSLIELVVVISLLGLVLAVVLSAMESAQRSEHYARGRVTSLDALQNSLDRMSKDLRQAISVDPTSTASMIDVQTYIDGVQHRVVYSIDGTGNLTRALDGGAAVVYQPGVLDPNIFSYLPSSANAESVQIDLSLRPESLPEAQITVQGEVEFRNVVTE